MRAYALVLLFAAAALAVYISPSNAAGLQWLFNARISAQRIHVTQNGAGSMSGLDWHNAVSGASLNGVLKSISERNDGSAYEFWIAAGDYPQDEALYVVRGVKLYGGFKGTESSIDERKISPDKEASAHIRRAVNAAKNFSLVVFSSDMAASGALPENTVIDGFYISDGSALRGGAISCIKSSPAIRNCMMVGNKTPNVTGSDTRRGGAVYVDTADPEITNCYIAENNAHNYGGGVYIKNGSPFIANTTFYKNSTSKGQAGGVYLENGSPRIINCTFSDNFVSPSDSKLFQGVALYSSTKSAPVVANSIFWNITEKAGASEIFVGTDSRPVLRSCVVKNMNIYSDNAQIISDDIYDEDPLLDSPAKNGGPVLTIGFSAAGSALQSGIKPNAEIVNKILVPSADARGEKRFSGVSADLGAYTYIAEAIVGECFLQTEEILVGEQAKIAEGSSLGVKQAGAASIDAAPAAFTYHIMPENTEQLVPVSADSIPNGIIDLPSAITPGSYKLCAVTKGLDITGKPLVYWIYPHLIVSAPLSENEQDITVSVPESVFLNEMFAITVSTNAGVEPVTIGLENRGEISEYFEIEVEEKNEVRLIPKKRPGGQGSAAITVWISGDLSGGRKKISKKVTVRETLPGPDLKITPETAALAEGMSLQFSTILTVPSGQACNIVWKSSDPSIAEPDIAGNVFAKTPGCAEISAETVYNGQRLSASAKIIVRKSIGVSGSVVPYIPDMPSGSVTGDIPGNVALTVPEIAVGHNSHELILQATDFTDETVALDEAGALFASLEIANRALADAARSEPGLSFDCVTKLPVMRTETEAAGQIHAISVIVPGDIFGEISATSEAKVLKIFPTGAGSFFKMLAPSAQIDDKTAAIFDEQGRIVFGEVDKNVKYTLTVFVKDGGEYDLTKAANGVVIDPIAIVKVKQAALKEDPAAPGVGVGEGGGGCSSGASAPFAALLCTALVFMGGRRRGV